jgi:hypothetical protein
MKNILFLMISISLLLLSASGAELTLSGSYFGKNLYIKNYVKDPAQFCTISVTVNSRQLGNQINSSSYEVNFESLGIAWGEKVTVKIEHKEGCKPEVINPEVLKPVPGGTFIYSKADKNSINWTTIGESGPFPYQVQQHKWDRWVTIGEIMGEGKADTAHYKYGVKHLNGPNVYRIYQTDPVSGRFIVSDDIKIRSANPVITFDIEKGNVIRFSEATQYEIYNSDGEIVDHGEGTDVDISSLPKGEFHLAYGSTSETFKK